MIRTLPIVVATILLCGCTMEEFQESSQLFTEAIQEKNPDKCEEIAEEGRFLCFMTIALDTQDPGLCQRIQKTDQRDSCLMSVATATKNPSICEDIEAEDKMSQCRQAMGMNEQMEENPQTSRQDMPPLPPMP